MIGRKYAFELAIKWYREDALSPEQTIEILEMLENPKTTMEEYHSRMRKDARVYREKKEKTKAISVT